MTLPLLALLLLLLQLPFHPLCAHDAHSYADNHDHVHGDASGGGGHCASTSRSASTSSTSASTSNQPTHAPAEKRLTQRSRRIEFVETLIKTPAFREKFEPPAFVVVPGGEFTMGTDVPINPEDGESPARRMRVSTFELMETEVSVAQFADFAREKDNYETEAEKFGWSFAFEGSLSKEMNEKIRSAVADVPWWVPVEGANWMHPEGPDSDVLSRLDFPVVHVSHNDAKAFCAHIGGRLPREAEYEYAMRGGKENQTYAWGNELVPGGTHRANLWQGDFPKLNTAEDGYLWSGPVRALGPQNDFGLFNIVGNVWEWVADAWTANHRKYWRGAGHVLEDLQIEIGGKVEDPAVERVKRGGSYMCHESYCLRYYTASRSHNSGDSTAQNLGFRCARDVGGEEEDDEEEMTVAR